MDASVNTLLIQRYITEAWNTNNLAVLDEITADPEPYRTTISTLRIAYPDLHITIDEISAEGNVGAVRWTAHSTHEVGVQLHWVGTTFHRIQESKIVEAYRVADRLTLLEQLGSVPAQRASSPLHEQLHQWTG